MCLCVSDSIGIQFRPKQIAKKRNGRKGRTREQTAGVVYLSAGRNPGPSQRFPQKIVVADLHDETDSFFVCFFYTGTRGDQERVSVVSRRKLQGRRWYDGDVYRTRNQKKSGWMGEKKPKKTADLEPPLVLTFKPAAVVAACRVVGVATTTTTTREV